MFDLIIDECFNIIDRIFGKKMENFCTLSIFSRIDPRADPRAEEFEAIGWLIVDSNG